MIPEFPHASKSFREANPHIFITPHDIATSSRMKSAQTGASGAAGAGPTGESKEELKSEKKLQDQIVGFLERNKTVVIRSRTDKKTTTTVGTPDLLFALKGHAMAFEVKLPGKKLSQAQEKMMSEMSDNGWWCFVVYTYDDAVKIYNKHFLQLTVDGATH